ncbi:ABC transporter ATP-binding protein [Dactylosporangium sucinum]|uniref:ABC transporter ATP-binding protein n=1 Tax=Dactylosporangium sucinum TaxID=1424081 RepID=A0A917X0L1_9ACTN|nr:ATP-binding cassette domain-containing protein [Dactylosporangium sucinum]GGM48455.1 ABC transporter ATP-binding protein [Dactylosporangium sucinum]
MTVLSLAGVSLRRDGRTLLRDVDWTVRESERWALLGANGAGKSTLLGLAGAVTHPTTGTVEVLGRRLGRVDLRELRRDIGHVNPRHPLRSPLTVTEVVLTGATGSVDLVPRWKPTPEEHDRAWELITLLGMQARAEATWPVLSQGERGRALIARALLSEPRLLLLDEPATGLDVAAREQLIEVVDRVHAARPALASVIVTHHLEELPSSTTHAALIRDGAITALGPAVDVLTTANVTEAFRHPIRITQDDEGRWQARSARS